MKQAFIEENYLDTEVEIDIGGRTLYKGGLLPSVMTGSFTSDGT